MRNAKNGKWWEDNGQRALANNSVAYTEKPDIGVFMQEWHSLYESKSGERGIFNRVAAEKKAAENGRRLLGFDWGTNPCGEIILRPAGPAVLHHHHVVAGGRGVQAQDLAEHEGERGGRAEPLIGRPLRHARRRDHERRRRQRDRGDYRAIIAERKDERRRGHGARPCF